MIVNFAERAHNHNWELEPGYPVVARYRFLQAADAAVCLEAFSENSRFVLAHQSLVCDPSGGVVSSAGDRAADGARPQTPLSKI